MDFVRRHLDDRGLTTSSVAAAHHVSTRTLNDTDTRETLVLGDTTAVETDPLRRFRLLWERLSG